MRKWALLSAAITIEVAATLSLRASRDHWGWLVVVVAGYVGAFVLLTLVLRAGIPIGVTYGIWGALGTAGAFDSANKKLLCNVDFGGNDEVLKDVSGGTIYASVALQFPELAAQQPTVGAGRAKARRAAIGYRTPAVA